jgi:alkylation response protein AidB-like acyl-CoA dehydrogenase
MDFDLPGESDPRRVEIRAWFERNPNPTGRDVFEAGFAVPLWPRPWGLGADPELALIVAEELERANVSAAYHTNPVAVNNCAQSLLTHGTDALRERFLAPALACEELWCMLFSEPGAGSDLAAVQTTATRDGGDYVIKGHKIWTSYAEQAAVGVCVARTDPHAPKHAGLSQFLIDMRAPGVTVTPIIDMSGVQEYNEVFLDNVRVPAERLLGREGDGWHLCNTQLQTERVALSKPGAVWGKGPSARELVAGLVECGAIADPLIRDEAAKLYIEGEILRLLAYRSFSDGMNAKPAGPEGAAHKMIAAPHGQRLLELAKRVQGARGLVEGVQPFAAARKGAHTVFDDWDYAFWFSPGITLGVGTQEILKNVVAERVLGLPRERDASAGVPWSEARQQQRDLLPA